MDPKKAEAVERLGMGVSAAGAKQNARFTHSAMTQISSIEQEEPSGGRNSQGRAHCIPCQPKPKYLGRFSSPN